MEKIKKIILNKEEQQTLRNYYKMVEEFQKFKDSPDLEDAGEWITELALDYGTLGLQREYDGIVVEMEGY